MMEIVNLTPHGLHIECADGTFFVVAPSGHVPRVQTSRVRLEPIPTPDGRLIPVSRVTFGELDSFPEPQPGVVFVCSALCATHPALSGRADVFCPGEAIRDADGRIIGSRGLSRVSEGGQR
jgi:hypothetical protein